MSSLVNDVLIFISSSLAVVAGVAIALRRRQERSILEPWARRHGWKVGDTQATTLDDRLSSSALTQIGHSRRLAAVIQNGSEVELFEYHFETGLEHDRQSHRWIGVVIPKQHDYGRATFTTEPWVIAAASSPGLTRLSLAQGVVDSRGARRSILVEDAEAMHANLVGDFGRRMESESPARTWELLHDCLLGYQSGPMSDEQVGELVAAGKELAKLL
jgi:hypothetical protein